VLRSESPRHETVMTRVSILIVNYQAYEEVAACLASIRRAVPTDTPVVLVDHESVPSLAAPLARAFPALEIIAGADNPGFAAGVNRAARASKTPYFLLLNPDCIVNDDVTSALAAWMDANPRVGACGALVRESNGAVQPSARRFPDATTGVAGRTAWLTRVWPGNPLSERNLLLPSDAREPMPVDWVSGACMMVRRAAFDEVGGMDEGFFLYWEDADFCRRLRDRGWSTAYDPAISVTHLTSRSSARAPVRSLIAFHAGAFRYHMKHAGLFGWLASPFVALALALRLAVKLASTGLQRFRRHTD
jgi:N-acetylglucosaminyl-diphospho-decaprenol L-rhamnosyltransferase